MGPRQCAVTKNELFRNLRKNYDPRLRPKLRKANEILHFFVVVLLKCMVKFLNKQRTLKIYVIYFCPVSKISNLL